MLKHKCRKPSNYRIRKVLTLSPMRTILEQGGVYMKTFYSGIVLNEEELLESNSNRIELEYYKLSKKDRKNTNTYGIEIIKKEYTGNKKTKEKQNIVNLTNDENIINKVLYILRKNTVTPVGLNDALQEVL